MSALKGMFSFFTMIRLDITQKDMDDMDRKMYLVPFVGVFYGLLAVGLMLFFNHYLNTFIAAILTMFIIHGMNRFLHVDGTIDVGDGLVVAGKREDHLRALKDTRIGAGGMAFAFFVIIMTIGALSSVWPDYLIILPFVAEILSKNSMVAAAAFGKPGDGMAGNSVRNTNGKSLIISTVISALIIVLFIAMMIYAGFFDVVDIDNLRFWTMIDVAIVISIITGAIMSAIASKNFGMTNGDVLGATNELSRAVTLILMLALIPVI